MTVFFNCYITNCIFILGVGYPSICKNFVILYNLESLTQGGLPSPVVWVDQLQKRWLPIRLITGRVRIQRLAVLSGL